MSKWSSLNLIFISAKWTKLLGANLESGKGGELRLCCQHTLCWHKLAHTEGCFHQVFFLRCLRTFRRILKLQSSLGDKLRVQSPWNVKENNYSPCFAQHLEKNAFGLGNCWTERKVLAGSWKSSVHWQWWLLQIKFRPVWNRSWCLFTAQVWGPQWHCKAPRAIYK